MSFKFCTQIMVNCRIYCFRLNMDFVNLNLLLSFLSNISFIINVFKHKNINNAILCHCYKENTVISMQKMLLEHNIQVSSLKIAYNASYKIPQFYDKIGITLDTSCEKWQSIFDSVDSKNPFINSLIWVIITEDISSTANILSYYPIEVDSDVTILHKIGNIFHVYEIYNTGFYNNGVFNIKRVGFWDNGLEIFKRNRMDLSGVILKCTVVIIPKDIANETMDQYLDHPKNYKVDSVHKMKFFTLLKYFTYMYNFTYNLQRTNSWGYVRNGSFDGMVGALQRKESDIGGSSVFYRIDRTPFVDYVFQSWQTRPCFILRHPKQPGGFYTIYTRPLTAGVWYCIIGLLLLSSVVLGVMLKIKTIRVPEDEEDCTPSLALLFAWSSVCQQGMTVNRKSTSVKLLVFVLFVYAVTLYQYYNATVVSTLLRESPKNIRTLKDLAESDLKAGIEDVIYMKDFFKRTTDPIALQIYHKKIATATHYNFFNPEHGIALVKRGGFAFHMDSAAAYPLIRTTFTEREICDIQEVQLFPAQDMAAVVRKGLPYKEHLTYGVRKMSESGIMQRLKTVWDEPKPPCVKTPDSSIFSVTIREFSTALIVLAFGMLASLAVLLCELLMFNIYREHSHIAFRN